MLVLLVVSLFAQAERTIAVPAEPGGLFFSADGKSLVTTCRDGHIRTFDVASGKLIRDVEHKGARLAGPARFFDSDGKKGTRIWDLTEDRQKKILYGGHSDTKALSSDGKLLAFGDAKARQLRWFDVETGKQKHSVPDGVGSSDLTFSPDGATLVAANDDNDVRIFSTRSGELVRKIEDLTGAMFATAFTADGAQLVMAGLDRTVYVLDAKSFSLSRKIEGHEETISALAISPDGRTLVTGGFDVAAMKNPVKVVFWDFASGKILKTIRAPHQVVSLAISPDSQWVAMTSGDKEISLWSLVR